MWFSMLSERGFLPTNNPLQQLPDQSRLNQTINDIANNLPLLMKEKRLRIAIDDLNANYSNEKLMLNQNNPQEKAIAFLTLLMLAQSYVWEDADHPANVLPEVLATNIYHLSREEQRFPTLCYTDYVLNNWRMIDPEQGITLDNIQPIYTFTGSVDEAWFIKIHVVIEAACGIALKAIQESLKLADDFKITQTMPLITLLQQIGTSLSSAVLLLQQMTDHCQPIYFYNVLRIYLSGWENVATRENNKEIKGIKFAGVDPKHFHSYRGASGAQSSILPALDAFLGIKHEINNMFMTLLMFKQYMPHAHQFFIASLIDNKVAYVISQAHCEKLNIAWQNIINQVAQFRAEHISIVHEYIHKPAVNKGIGTESLIGTGGAPMEYLNVRHETTTSRDLAC